LTVAEAFLPLSQALPLADADRLGRVEIMLAERPNSIQHGLILAGSMVKKKQRH
jgi:hypothetical protein